MEHKKEKTSPLFIVFLVIGVLTCLCLTLIFFFTREENNQPTSQPTNRTSSITPTPNSTINPVVYKEIDIRELDNYTENYIDQKVRLLGKVFNIDNNYLQIHVQKPGDKKWDTIPVIISFSKKVLPPGVYEDTYILVYGTVSGESSGKNLFGGVISQPNVTADFIEIITETESDEMRNIPTATSEIRALRTPDNSVVVAKNNVAEIEDSGITIEVLRVLICDKDWDGIEDLDLAQYETFSDKDTMIEYVFKITNDTDVVAHFFFTSSIASANGEQVSFVDFRNYGAGYIGNDLGSDILPGSYIIGGLWTGYSDSSWDEIKKIVISVDSAHGSSFIDKLTGNYLFTIDVINWEFEPLPTVLKDSAFR